MSNDNETNQKSLFNQHLDAGTPKSTVDAYFDGYDDYDPVAEEQDFQQKKQQMQQAVFRLEQRFAARGLKFTQNFAGGLPVQAFGIIDNMRFYFRFRHDTAALRVGELDPDKPLRDYDRAVAARMVRTRKADELLRNGEITPEEHASDLKYFNRPARIEYPNGKDDYPTLIKKEARISNFLNEPYAGELSADEAEKVFIELVEALEDVDYDLNAPTA